MSVINIRDTAQWARLLRSQQPPHPLLVHLNGDTTWLLQLPRPPGDGDGGGGGGGGRRTHFNLLIDPWLQGPQSDVASWFSTQFHVVEPAVGSLAELQAILQRLHVAMESDAAAAASVHSGNGRAVAAAAAAADTAAAEQGEEEPSFIDAVAISHEFTDHCHKATLLQLPPETPIYAADVAADLIRSWAHFAPGAIITAPGLARDAAWSSLPGAKLPSWLRIARLVTSGNSLYYHSALVIAFPLHHHRRRRRRPETSPSPPEAPSSSSLPGEAIVYSPHGISAADVAALPSCALSALAMLHGLHDVRLLMMKQLNLGALNAVEAVRASGARYWVGTHDEEKKGKGLIAPLLRRTRYTLRQAVAHDDGNRRMEKENYGETEYQFAELASGEALLLV